MDDWELKADEIECGRCGTRFYYELTRCPKCGASVYEPEYDEPDPHGANRGAEGATWDQALGAVALEVLYQALVIAWWLIAAALSILLYFGMRALLGADTAPLILQGLAYGCVSAGAFAGGYLEGRFARRRSRFGGLLVGLLSLSTALLLLAYEFADLGQALLSWFTPLGAAMVMASAWFGARLASRATQQARLETLFGLREQKAAPDEEGLYIELLMKVNFESDIADRLVEYERQRSPRASRYELIRAAILRWERDNRSIPGGPAADG